MRDRSSRAVLRRCGTVSEKDSVDATAGQKSPAAYGPRTPADIEPPVLPGGVSGRTVLVEWPPGDPGLLPTAARHRVSAT